MIHDLLYKVKENTDHNNLQLSDDLMLNKTFASYFPKQDDLIKFTKMLCSPLKNTENICFRRELIFEFYSQPQLLSKINNILKQIKFLHDDIYAQRIHRAMNSPLLLLKMRANAVKTILELFAELTIIAKGLTTQNQVLCSLIERIIQVGDDNNSRKFIQYCDKIENISSDQAHYVEIELNEHSKIQLCALTDVGIQTTIEQTTARKKLFQKQYQAQPEAIQLNFLAAEDAKTLYTASLNTLSELLYDVENLIFAEFLTAADQIDFYVTAIEIMHTADNKGIKWCFAELNNGSSLCVNQLCDLLLAVNGVTPISNSISIDISKKGIIIKGDNNSGKTVFLRSFAVAYLMSLQGLPILSESATLPQKSGIYSLFASSERSLAQNMGRFEQEVERLATIIDSITSDQILIMNEPFQTTEYTEGAIGLYGILEYLSDINVFWIVVTHLDELKLLAKSNDRIATFNMTDEHKLTQE